MWVGEPECGATSPDGFARCRRPYGHQFRHTDYAQCVWDPAPAPDPAQAVVLPYPPLDAVRSLLEYVGEDPDREGLVDTPGRVLRALAELTQGHLQDPSVILERTFPDHYDEMVVLRGVTFTSLCEHHLLPFVGTARVGYIPAPGRGVVGLSKLARLVQCFAQRLQVQERMTMQIADALEEHLHPLGVGVLVEAHHSCMGCRGVRQPGAVMVTSALRGALRDEPETRAEFLSL